MTDRCAALSLERGDPRAGSAAPVPRWLLLEQPGPWGRDALLSSRLDPVVAVGLIRRCAAAGLRPMLIRRPGRVVVPAGRRRWAVIDSRPDHAGSWWGEFDQDTELLDLPLDGSAGAPSDAPTYLVCTHARHDACCAIRGRPVAAALAAIRPAQTWECSHVGGDRFAANVVVLPHGLYYGTVNVNDVPALVADHEAGRLTLPLLRGRSSSPMPVQAAEIFLRERLGDTGIDAVRSVGAEKTPDGGWTVRFDHPDGRAVVVIQVTRSEPLPRLTCGAAGSQRVTTYEPVDVRLG